MSSSILLVVLAAGVPPFAEPLTDGNPTSVAMEHRPSPSVTVVANVRSWRRQRRTIVQPDQGSILAQRPDFGHQAGGRFQVGQPNLLKVIPQVIRPQGWQPNGGPGRVVLFQRGGGAGFGGRNERNGRALADLIQEVVEPDSWEINGGPGRIAIFGQ